MAVKACMKRITSLVALTTLAMGACPTFASADHWHDRHHRIHDSGDGWRDLTILGGVAALAGVATHNSTLTAVGAAGAVYSGIRYENDRNGGGYGWHGYADRRHEDRRWRDHRYEGYGHRS